MSVATSWSVNCFDRFICPCDSLDQEYDPTLQSNHRVTDTCHDEVKVVEFCPSEYCKNSELYSNIYCQGILLHDVQLARLYNDSKTFVDLKLKYPEDEVLSKYDDFRTKFGGKTPPPDQLQVFVNENFEQGDELEEWTPSDFNPKPSLVDRVTDPMFKQWVKDLNDIHLTLSRKVKADVKVNPGLYSLLYVPNGFVIPGGRFRELYYWDTYWILNGLLLCDMTTTARGIIENFFYLIRTYNIIPNGSRKYYLQRSQPPLLIPMVEMYYEHTKDLEFVRQNIDTIEQEFDFWMKNRMVRLKKNNVCYKLARYYCPSSGPRPESYREDYVIAESLPTEDQKNELYINIKSAAESGLDFSTRWFIKNGTNSGNLSDIDTAHILPVDLNAFLEYNARVLSTLYAEIGNASKAAYYKHRANKMLLAIEAILWKEDRGIWLDYDLKNLKSRDYFYMSNFAPLWTSGYRQSKPEISKKVLAYLAENKVDDYVGGIPTSLSYSGEQWDFPNGWPPLQAILIQGLERLQTPEGDNAARNYAFKWLHSNYKGFKVFQKMFEKYDVTLLGQTGEGGEYERQTGFGWSNGVVMQLLNKYGRDISLYPQNGTAAS